MDLLEGEGPPIGPDGEPLAEGEGGPPIGPDGEPLPPGEGGPPVGPDGEPLADGPPIGPDGEPLPLEILDLVVHLLDLMENHWLTVHPLDPMESHYHLENLVLVVLHQSKTRQQEKLLKPH